MQMFHDQTRTKWIKLADQIFLALPTTNDDRALLDLTKAQALDLIKQGATYTVTVFETGTISVSMDT